MHKDFIECGNNVGPLLVFIHGSGMGGWMWDKNSRQVIEDWIVHSKKYISNNGGIVVGEMESVEQ
ncbi:hypothetical protein M3193_00555 [Sporosarcina luteola]|uniref:hypothetical protein n=1 Tax=Sporosarcina luteola TaxID=582850 RepID=UPI00203C3EAB|nr:hypothetical protein [Sporosarcina luteola]MCM3742618.1 hypothetical protein [Sporosarcina luteola]